MGIRGILSTVNFRSGISDDLVSAVDMVRKFTKEVGTSEDLAMLDTEHFSKMFETLILSPAGFVWIAANTEDTPVGMLLGMCTSSVFSKTIAAEEILWWVEPSYRGQSSLMLKEFEIWARACNASTVVVAGFDNMQRFYERSGYTKRSAHYSKFLNKLTIEGTLCH